MENIQTYIFIKHMNKCLYIVDVQKGFVKSDCVSGLPSLIEQLQQNYKHVIAACFYNPPVSPYRDLLGMEKMNAGQPDTELAFQLKEGAIGIYKSCYGGDQKDLLDYLQREKITAIDICGVNTEACVYMTAVGLFERHYDVRVLSNACGSSLGAKYHEAGLLALESAIGSERVVR